MSEENGLVGSLYLKGDYDGAGGKAGFTYNLTDMELEKIIAGVAYDSKYSATGMGGGANYVYDHQSGTHLLGTNVNFNSGGAITTGYNTHILFDQWGMPIMAGSDWYTEVDWDQLEKLEEERAREETESPDEDPESGGDDGEDVDDEEVIEGDFDGNTLPEEDLDLYELLGLDYLTNPNQDYLNSVEATAEDIVDDYDLQRGYDDTNATWCNRYLDRLLTSLGIEHDVLLESGDVSYKDENGELSNLQYTRANDMVDNAAEAAQIEGSGVIEVDAETAQLLANSGAPVIATYRNYNTDDDGNYLSGHVALVIPDENAFDSNLGPRITQAGVYNYSPSDNKYVRDGFYTPWSNNEVKFYLLDTN